MPSIPHIYFIMFKDKQKDAINAFESWAKRTLLPLTAAFETWTKLVVHYTRLYGNKREPDYVFRFKEYVYPFTLAVLGDQNSPIVCEETQLWVMWHGRKQYVHVSGYPHTHTLIHVALLWLGLK